MKYIYFNFTAIFHPQTIVNTSKMHTYICVYSLYYKIKPKHIPEHFCVSRIYYNMYVTNTDTVVWVHLCTIINNGQI